MAEKTSEQLAQELDTLEIPGNQNPWQKKDTRYTNSILSEASTKDFSGEVLSNIIRRDQNILDGVNNRTSLVIATTPVSEYEKLTYQVGLATNNGDNAVLLNKVYTRNAESKCFFLNPPWKYADDPVGNFKKSISRELHTHTITSADETGGEQPQEGQFFDILYDDQTENTAKLLKKKKQGIVGFPELFSSIASFTVTDQWPGGDASIVVPDSISKAKRALGTKKGTSTADQKNIPDEANITKEVAAFWQPVYNPCAVPAGQSGPTTGSPFGPRNHPTKGGVRWHEGIDMWKSEGYPIVAVADGEVEYVSHGGKQPNNTKIGYVVIKHTLPSNKAQTYTVKTRYMHLFLFAEPNGKILSKKYEIKAGEVLGYMGGEPGTPGAGTTTSAHLHFEVLVSKKVDGIETYDKFTKTGPNGESMTIKGSSNGRRGPTDPTYFSYPNLARFDKTQIDRLIAQRPTKIKTQENLITANSGSGEGESP